MPQEPTTSKLKRKSTRREAEDFRFDSGHARDIEQKRNNGQISCAECRRLKIKCDKQIPCQSCQRRGCAALCPNGSLATGQGTRFVIAATEHLHRQIANMSGRIRQLEDALGSLQSQLSTEPHPLLSDESLGASQKDDYPSLVGDHRPGPSNPPEIQDAFGTLSIADHGIARFFGPTGGSECLLMSDKTAPPEYVDASSPESARDSSPGLPQDFRLFSNAFPFTPVGPVGTIRDMIEGHLPSWDRARYLVQTYLAQAAWLCRSLSAEQIMEELLPLYYSNGVATPPDENKVDHELALLLLVFAVGSVVDLAQEPSNAEAEHYHQLARAALCLQSVLEKPSFVTIQAIHLLSFYNALSGNELSTKDTSMETTWSLLSLAAHLAQSIGIHRDSAKWGLPAKAVQRRRILFWDLFIADAWHSLNTGRPPSFSLVYADCKYPETGEGEYGYKAEFALWGIKFAAECVAEAASRTLTAESPSYAVITEIDRKIREFPMPGSVTLIPSSTSGASPPAIGEEPLPAPEAMSQLVMSHARENLLLYIHRSFFAQAIMENPVNPLKSAYAPSFLAAYRASQTILRTVESAFLTHPSLCARFWFIWTFAFSAAIVFGTIVTRGPRSPLASNAMKELDDACLLFSRASAYSRRAAQALPILTKLSEKAHVALAAAQTDQVAQQMGQQWSVKEEQDDDELAIFAGKTRFVSVKRGSSVPVDGESPPPSHGNNNAYAQPSGSFEPPQTVQLCCPVTGRPLSDGDRQYDMHSDDPIPISPSASIPAQLWQSPQSSHYPYAPQHNHNVSYSSGPSHPQHTPSPVVGSSSAHSWASSESSSSSPQQPQEYRHQAPFPVSVPIPVSGPGVVEPQSQSQSQQSHGFLAYDPSPAVTVDPYHGRHQHQHSHQHSQQHLQQHPQQHAHQHAHPHPHQHQHQNQHQNQQQQHQQQQHVRPPPPELAELGLVSQDSRLDERWTSFMRESGYFDEVGYRSR